MKALTNEQQDSITQCLSKAEIAVIILEELEDEAKWDKACENSQDALTKLAANAMAEYHARIL